MVADSAGNINNPEKLSNGTWYLISRGGRNLL